MLDNGIETVKLHVLLGGVPFRIPEADAMTITMPAITMAQVAMMLVVRFIHSRHRGVLVLYALS